METSDVVHQFPVASALDPHTFWLTCFTKFTTDLKLAQKANISGYKPESRQQSPCLGNKHERKQPHHFLWHRRHLDTLDLSPGVRLSAPSFTVMSRAIRQVCWKDLNYYKKVFLKSRVDELLIASQILIFLLLPCHIYICTLYSIEHVNQCIAGMYCKSTSCCFCRQKYKKP